MRRRPSRKTLIVSITPDVLQVRFGRPDHTTVPREFQPEDLAGRTPTLHGGGRLRGHYSEVADPWAKPREISYVVQLVVMLIRLQVNVDVCELAHQSHDFG